MKKFEELYQNICRDLLLESKKDAINKWGNTEEVNYYVDLFMNKNNRH